MVVRNKIQRRVTLRTLCDISSSLAPCIRSRHLFRCWLLRRLIPCLAVDGASKARATYAYSIDWTVWLYQTQYVLSPYQTCSRSVTWPHRGSKWIKARGINTRFITLTSGFRRVFQSNERAGIGLWSRAQHAETQLHEQISLPNWLLCSLIILLNMPASTETCERSFNTMARGKSSHVNLFPGFYEIQRRFSRWQWKRHQGFLLN